MVQELFGYKFSFKDLSLNKDIFIDMEQLDVELIKIIFLYLNDLFL